MAQRRQKRGRSRNWFEYLFFQTFLTLIRLVPLALGKWFGRQLGILAFKLLKGRRRLTIANIGRARKNGHLPAVSDDYGLARQVWEHLGLVGSEFLYYYSHDFKRLTDAVEIVGKENIEKVLAKRKGAVVVMAHIGNWELQGIYLAQHYGVSVIVKTQSNPGVDQIIQEKRQSAGMKIVPRTKFMRPLVEAFKRNDLVLFLIDQADLKSGIAVDFFGDSAPIPRGAAEFALKTDTPAIFAYIVRESNGRHRLVISEELKLSRTGNYEVDLTAAVRQMSGLVQEVINQYPSQWLWMHKLWRG